MSARDLAVVVLLVLGVGITLLSCVGVLVTTNPVLGHATARAARIRQFGEWTVREEEREGDRP